MKSEIELVHATNHLTAVTINTNHHRRHHHRYHHHHHHPLYHNTMPSFSERRHQARDTCCVLIARAHTSDRQVSDILHQSLYHLTNTGRLVTVLVVVELPDRAFKTSPLPPNKLPSRRQRTTECGLATETRL